MTDAALTRWALAQDSVLGSCLLSQRAVTTVLSQTTAEMFDEAHRPLYLAISATFAAGERVDPVTVSGRMPESSELRGYMMQLMEVTPTAAGATDYVRQLRELHRLRQVQELGQKLADAQQMEDVSALMGQLTGLMTVRQEARVFSFADLMGGFLDAHAQRPDYLGWGLPMLDKLLTVRPGSFVLLGGYPSAGKTALALQFAVQQARQGRRIGIFSYETDEAKLRDRMVAHDAGYPLADILTQTAEQMDYDKLRDTLHQLSELQGRVIVANGMTVSQIYSMSAAYGFDVIYVDYVQLVRPDNLRLPRHEQVAEISRQLQGMAHATGITVIGLSQLSRPEKPAQTQRQSKRVRLGDEEIMLPPRLIPVREPTMSDLRESGQFEQDADAILMVWRPYPDSEEITDRYLRIAKNKDGAAGGKIDLHFDGKTQRFWTADPRSLMQRIREAASPRRQEPPEPQVQQMTLTELTDDDPELPPEWRQDDG